MSQAPDAPSADSLTALLGRVEQNRERRCRELLRQAREEADATVAEAFRQGRTRLHETVREERRRTEERLRSRRAQLETVRRQREHQAVNAALTDGWDRIGAALAERWADPAGREEWLAAALAQAADFLPAGTWTVDHPPAWDPAELPAAPEGVTLQPVADDTLDTGIRLRRGNALVDATAEGLLRDQTRVQSWLLAEIAHLRQQEEGS